MRITLLLLVVTLRGFFGELPLSYGAGPRPEYPADEDGYLMLETKHEGLEVRIDGRFIGLTPLGFVALPPGQHKVRISPPAPGNWLDAGWFDNVRILPADTLRVPVVFETSYSIRSMPYEAKVLLDSEKIGLTPIFFKLFENEGKNVTLSKQGFADTTFAVGLGEKRFFDVKLKRHLEDIEISRAAMNDKLRSNSRSKRRLYTAGGLALVSGALALYFREKGNDRYDRYRSTGEPGAADRFFADAKRYDRFAAAAFGVFQVSFVASFYFFLKDANR